MQHIANILKFLIVNSLRRKSLSSIKELGPYVQIFPWNKGSGFSTLPSKLKKSLREDANSTSKHLGKTHLSAKLSNRKTVTKAKSFMVLKS
jgi:hypothetical protein